MEQQLLGYEHILYRLDQTEHIVDRLDRVIRSYLRRVGFEYAAYMVEFEHDWPLTLALIERWRSESHTFHLPCEEMTITLQDVTYQLGLRIDDDPMSGCRSSTMMDVSSISIGKNKLWSWKPSPATTIPIQTMLGFRNATNVVLRLRQNLSVWGVRAQNINIGGGVGGEIPDQKRLQYALQHIHGIGRSKAHHIVCELGVENKYVRDLSKRELYSLRELLSKKNVLKEMWGGWWAFSATEASGMSMAYPVEASELIPMPAPGRAGLLGGEQDEDEYCCL
ncbi:hypothetical protein AHAS_Ahas16G0232500 [Arachis hypogaea]